MATIKQFKDAVTPVIGDIMSKYDDGDKAIDFACKTCFSGLGTLHPLVTLDDFIYALEQYIDEETGYGADIYIDLAEDFDLALSDVQCKLFDVIASFKN